MKKERAVIFILLAFFLVCGIEGCMPAEIKCSDSDSGLDYSIKGYVEGFETQDSIDQWQDYCGISGEEKGKLVEYYCNSDGYGKKFLYDCPNGCKDGACITEECTDSDGGINYYEKGFTEGIDASGEPNKGWFDSCNILLEQGGTKNIKNCSGDNCILEELFCDKGKTGLFINSVDYKCPNGCQDGACVNTSKKEWCKETDNKKDYYTKGAVTLYDGTNYVDSCAVSKESEYLNIESSKNFSGSFLVEYYCVEEGYYLEVYECKEGCKDGACLGEG